MLRFMPKRSALFPLATILLCIGCREIWAPEWRLPIKLGQSVEEVRQTLGSPNDKYSPYKIARDIDPQLIELLSLSPSNTVEIYYSSGILCMYEGKVLYRITLNPISDYQGFLVYSGEIINGVRLTDSKDMILRKLGNPTKVEDDPIETGNDLNVPAVWPAHSRYYWRKRNYTIEVDLLRQAQSIDESKGITRPIGSISLVTIYK
ncbi:MAG: hypothetical protein LAO31_17590 [Acidobacteriia bacterium]|nr:hypothetical protein [Terriglobia bacterium]